MKVLVIGANGKVGRKIVKSLSDQKHEAIAMVRKEEQASAQQALGAKAVVADLERDISQAFDNHPDAVIFTAGSGGSTGQDKTVAVDLQGAKKAIDEARKHGVSRFVMVSALGVDTPDAMPEALRHYAVAKSEADQYLVQSALDYTIVRPGLLTDESGSGSVMAAQSLNDYGNRKVSRDNVANLVVAAIDRPNTHQKVIEMVDGEEPIGDALQKI